MNAEEQARVPRTTRTGPIEAPAYPPHPRGIPQFDLYDGRYRCRFAADEADLDAILRLRYTVFNLELSEGLDGSHHTGRDRDQFDAHCHHLLVEEGDSGAVVGTYRLQVASMAAQGHGFYTAREYKLDQWPATILEQAVEAGRACVARQHRRANVLLGLWKGLAAYAMHNGKRYFFGCCSITSQDRVEAARVLRYLEHHGHIHRDVPGEPQANYDCGEQCASTDDWESTKIPKLFRTYLRYGAKICGRPAIDHNFKTIDYLALVDFYSLDPARVLRQLEVDTSAGPDIEPPRGAETDPDG